ncbi:CPBP family intramembrane metalloprotease [filamentous cyanobacterium LEGE 11480]|uniref:CPBP family intramembrane metalloprotease n=1 Tax=Romeriopsis navalis LEGE 11480 TaxID=2777977 RepID=A0A928Z3N5_9CYAN|nr:CPBP family glutamic-type intramembrane protease [Romeriopsis navalis]MBE9029418.1 CPBP family intramembrane metalloprotease [Romeriopsis navalis LEGE 11480]
MQPIQSLRWHDRLRYRIQTAVITIPAPRDWRYTLILLGLFGLIYLPIGFHTGFLKLAPQLNPGLVITVAATALLMPGINEELIFRVLLLPHPTEPMRPMVQRLWQMCSWILFVLYHVPPWTPDFFKTPAFLIGVGLVGIACTFSYWQSRSIWTAVFLHWAIVSLWLLVFGGLAKFESVG